MLRKLDIGTFLTGVNFEHSLYLLLALFPHVVTRGCLDNHCQLFDFRFQITVQTGHWFGSGTSANVSNYNAMISVC